MNNPLIVVILTIFLSVCLYPVETKPSNITFIPIIPKNTHYLVNLTEKANKTFIYKSASKLKKDSKLTFQINPLSLDSPVLNVDLDVQVLNSTTRNKTSILLCRNISQKACTLKSRALMSYFPNDLQNKTKLYLVYQCKAMPCLFKTTILDSKELILPPSQSHIFYFKHSLSRIFNISIPARSSFDRIVLVVSFIKHADLKSFNLMPSIPSNTSDPNPSFLVYHEATQLILVFRNDNPDLPYNDNLSIELIAARINLYFEIHYTVFKPISEIKLDNVYYDNIDSRKYVAYKLKVPNNTNELYFELKNQFGDKKIIMISNVDFITKLVNDKVDIDSYLTFNHPSYLINIENEKINVLSKADIETDDKGYMYLLITPNSGCFSIEISMKNERITPLKSGQILRKRIENNEVQNLEIRVESDIDLTLDFSIEYGNADLYLQACDTVCLLLNIDDIANKSSFVDSIVNQEHRLMKFKPFCPILSSITGLCKYLIVIVGNSTSSKSSKYHILVKQGEDHLIDLPENRPISLFLEKDQDYYMRFWLEQDPNLKEVSFSLNSLSTTFFVGTTLECVKNVNCSDLTKGDYSHAIYESIADLNIGNLIYYIRIRSEKTSRTIFYVEVLRKDVPSIINLYDGLPMTGTLDKNKLNQLYSFRVDLKKKSKIYINLNCDSEKLIMYASDHHSLTKHQTFLNKFYKAYHWKSKDGIIVIDPSHSHYSKSMTYYILVTHKVNLAIDPSSSNETNIHEYEELSYYIMFSTENTLKSIQNNVPFYDKIEKKQTTFFKIYVNPESEELIVTKFLMRSSMNSVLEQQDLAMMVSPTPFETLNLTNIINLTRIFTDDITGSLYNSYHFDNNLLQALCTDKDNRYKTTCPLYISITNQGKNELLYGLTINIKGMASELFDGIENAISLSEFIGYSEKRFFYQIKDTFTTLEIFSESDFGTIYDVNVMFIDHRKKKLNVFDYKTVDNSFFVSANKSIHSIEISKEDVHQFCKIHCLLIVVLTVNTDIESLEKKYYSQSELLYVMVSSKMTVLQEGRHMIFSLKANQYKYFSYPLNNFLQNYNNNDSLVISLTPLSGTASFYVIESNNTNLQLPDSKNARFYSYGSHLTIQKDELSLKYDELGNPKLIMGVFSIAGGKFIIDLIQNNLVTINVDLPLNVLILAYEQRAFEFNSYWSLEGFQVKFFLDYGRGNLLVYKIEENKLLDEIIFNDNPLYNHTLIQSTINTINVESEEYCWSCNYYIIIQALTDIQGTLSVHEKGGIKQLMMNSAYFDNLEVFDIGKYRIDIPLNKRTEVILNIYSGSAHIEGVITSGYTYEELTYNLQGEAVASNYEKLVIPVEDLIEFYKTEAKSLGLKNKEADNYFRIRTITLNLKVSSLLGSTANYSIEVYPSDAIRVLKEGLIMYMTTNVSKKSVFIYEKHENLTMKNSKKDLNNAHLLIKSFGLQSLNIEVKAKFTENKLDYSISVAKSYDMNLTLIASMIDTLEYLIPTDKIGQFTFEITNKDKKKSIDYYIIVSTNKLTTLPYDISMSLSLPKNARRYYETFIPKKGVLALEIQECYGSVKIGRTKSYQKLMKGKGMLEEFDVLQDVDSINYYKVNKPEHFFFLVTATGELFTNIQITMKLYDNLKQIPQKNVKLPTGGSVDYLLEGNHVALNFSPILCPKCNQKVLDNVAITYELIIGNTLFDVDSVGKCRMGYPKFYQSKLKKDPKAVIVNENVTTLKIQTGQLKGKYDKNERISFDFVHNFESFESKLKEQGFSHFVTVRAKIDNYPHIVNKTVDRLLPSFDLYYETLELNFKVDSSIDDSTEQAVQEVVRDNKELTSTNLNYKKLLIIAIIVIIALLLCVIVACYYDRVRKRRAGLIHFSLDETKESRRPVRLATNESSDKIEIEMETKNLANNYNPENY